MKEQMPNVNEQPPKFPEKAEINEAIKNCVDNMFDNTEVFSDNVIKTLFSKDIQDLKRNNSQQNTLSREQLKA